MSKAYEMIAASLNELIEDYEENGGTNLTHDVMIANKDPFDSEENIRYLSKKLKKYKTGRLHLAKHNLAEA